MLVPGAGITLFHEIEEERELLLLLLPFLLFECTQHSLSLLRFIIHILENGVLGVT